MREKPRAVLTTNKPYKDEFLKQMNWMEKERQRNCSARDISVTIQTKQRGYKQDNGQCICFAFRNGTDTKITSTGYVQICVHKNRCFFREADSSVGYKISRPANSNSRYCKMAHVSQLKDFAGDFDLKYDEFLELYYIERNGNGN